MEAGSVGKGCGQGSPSGRWSEEELWVTEVEATTQPQTSPELWAWSYSKCVNVTVLCQKSEIKYASYAGFASRYFLLFFKPAAQAETLGGMRLGKPLWMGTKATAGTCDQGAGCQHFPTVFSQIIVCSHCCSWFPRDGAILTWIWQ